MKYEKWKKKQCFHKSTDRLGGEVVERLPRMRDVACSISDRVMPNMVVMAQGCRVSTTTDDWLVSGSMYQKYSMFTQETPSYN